MVAIDQVVNSTSFYVPDFDGQISLSIKNFQEDCLKAESLKVKILKHTFQSLAVMSIMIRTIQFLLHLPFMQYPCLEKLLISKAIICKVKYFQSDPAWGEEGTKSICEGETKRKQMLEY